MSDKPLSAPSDAAPLASQQRPTYDQLADENQRLRDIIARLQQQQQQQGDVPLASSAASLPNPPAAQADLPPAATSASSSPSPWQHGLTSAQIARYSRQLILSDFGGADAQRRLLASSVLIIGAGGLGSPVALYLAAAGVGRLVIVDGDRVDESNLHRQVIHTEARAGEWKAESAREACRAINSGIRVEAVCQRLSEANAVQLVSGIDLVIDASDNVPTRYLCNDAAIACGKPLVSGSALRLEGQVSVFGLHGGPCYRCLYPTPPPAASVTNCSDGGVIGALVGVIGSIQALEAIKILAGLVPPPDASTPHSAILSAQSNGFDPLAAAATHSTLNNRLLLFDGASASFRSVKLRPRQRDCPVCGDSPSITRETLLQRSIDYQHFCGSSFHDGPRKIPTAARVQHVSVHEYRDAVQSAKADSSPPPLLLDVREPVQYRICALPNAVNVPLRVLKREMPAWLKQMLHPSSTQQSAPDVHSLTSHPAAANGAAPPVAASATTASASAPRAIYVMCRRGIDSVAATRLLLDEIEAESKHSEQDASESNASADVASSRPIIRNVSGGLQAWTDKIDPSFPLY